MDGPKPTTRNDAAKVTFRDFSGSSDLIRSNGTRSVDGKTS